MEIFKVPLHSKMCIAYYYLSWMFDLECAEFDTRTLFSHSSAGDESFSVIFDITTCLEANRGLVFNLFKCDVETSNLQRIYTKNGLCSEVGGIVCPVVKLLK